MNILKQIILCIGIVSIYSSSSLAMFGGAEQWDWEKIRVDDVKFPKDFLWGAATSSYQIEGTETYNGKLIENSWTHWEKKHNLKPVEDACDSWKNYTEDVRLAKEAGLKAYRFSIAWEKVMPKPREFDEEAMQHYIDLVTELKKNGIEPVVTLFHHYWPEWFDQFNPEIQKKYKTKIIGGFEKKKNREYFVKFFEYVFEKLNPDPKNPQVKIWMPFNEPVGFALEAYYRGKYAPGKKDLRLAGQVVKNMLFAHVEIAQKIKEKVGNEWHKTYELGIAKVFNPLSAYPTNDPMKFAITGMAAKIFNSLLHDSALEFFKTGKFSWGIPGHSSFRSIHTKAPESLTFIGINYYSNSLLQMHYTGKKNEKGKKKIIMAETMPGREKDSKGKRGLYPEGLYWAIKKAATLKKPLYIMENGFNLTDPKNPLRTKHHKQHLWVVSKAIKENIDIKGFFWWSLMDTAGWGNIDNHKADRYESKYGLYEVDFDDPKKKRTLKPSVYEIVNLMKFGSYFESNVPKAALLMHRCNKPKNDIRKSILY